MPAQIKDAVAALTRELMTLQAAGDYAKAKEHAGQACAWSARTCSACSTASRRVPVDIEPRFVTADELSGRTAPAARQTPAASRKASTTRQ